MSRVVAIAVAAALMASVASHAVVAQEAPPVHEIWVGAHATEDTWFIYSGGTTAPFGNLNQDGFRLRAVAGHGEYKYEGHQLRIYPDNSVGFAPVTFTDRVSFTDALVGYMLQMGPLTAKGFVGLAFVDHDVSAAPGFKAFSDGLEWGPKIQAEFWYDPGEGSWTALNLSYTTAHDTYAINTRSGFRLDDNWSIGTELNLDNRGAEGASLNGAYARGGAFLRYAWQTGEISASGGVAVDIDESPELLIDEQQSIYGGLNILTKF